MAGEARRRRDQGGRILEAALRHAEADGWEGVRLRRVAADLGIDLETVRRHYRDLDAVADAWFRLALDAMLATPAGDLAGRPPRERVNHLLLRWFDALAPHRRITAEMLATKLYASHPHHWVPMVFNLSRLIQWLRDGAALDAGGRRRQVEEVGLTLLFLATLALWCGDASPGQARTRRTLDWALRLADEAMASLWTGRRGGRSDASATREV